MAKLETLPAESPEPCRTLRTTAFELVVQKFEVVSIDPDINAEACKGVGSLLSEEEC